MWGGNDTGARTRSPGVTIAEWIDSQGRPVPAAFRSFLNAEGRASLANLLAASETEMDAYTAGDMRSRDAAFALLAADAYLTYACLRAVRENGGTALTGITERIATEWTPRTRE